MAKAENDPWFICGLIILGFSIIWMLVVSFGLNNNFKKFNKLRRTIENDNPYRGEELQDMSGKPQGETQQETPQGETPQQVTPQVTPQGTSEVTPRTPVPTPRTPVATPRTPVATNENGIRETSLNSMKPVSYSKKNKSPTRVIGRKVTSRTKRKI